MTTTPYTVVIATMDRPEALTVVLDCLDHQTLPPAEIVVVDASDSATSREAIERRNARVPVRHLRAGQRSAARQRNQGATEVRTPLLAFLDDDISFGPEVMARVIGTFDERANAVGVAARIEGPGHKVPSALLRLYYRLQAGYAHPHYGGRLFGAAINCFPCYAVDAGPLIQAEWLNAGLVVFRTAEFLACRFPDFDGYSFMEDAYASATMRRRGGALYFRSDAMYVHYDLPNRFKRDARELARHRMINRERIARDILGLQGWRLRARLFLHRLFLTAWLLRARPANWRRELAGTWA